MTKQPNFPEWLVSIGISMLKSFAWIVTATLVVFVASLFVKLPSNRADIFSLIEVFFGVIITALSIVASFAIAFNWGKLDSNVRRFTEASQNVGRQIQEQNTRLQGLREDYATIRADYARLQSNLQLMLQEAQDLRRFIEDTHILDQTDSEELRKKYEKYVGTRRDHLETIELLLKGMTQAFDEDVRAIATEVVEQALKARGVPKENNAEKKQTPELSSSAPDLPVLQPQRVGIIGVTGGKGFGNSLAVGRVGCCSNTSVTILSICFIADLNLLASRL